MDTKNLRYFEAVYEERSINTAAKKLFISPQGLGKIIRGMEAEFNTSFFERTKQGMIPTQNGTVFYEQSKRISKEFLNLSEQLKVGEHQRPLVRIGFANGVLKAIPLEKVLEFTQKHPDIRVEWCEYENQILLQKVMDSKIDYALVIGKSKYQELDQKLIGSIPVSVYVYEGHPFFDREYITLDMLKNENIIIMNEQYRIYHDFVHACEVEGFTPHIKAKTMDGGTLYMWVSQGLGLAISPNLPLQIYKNVRAIPFQTNYSWDIYRIYRKEQSHLSLMHNMDIYWEN